MDAHGYHFLVVLGHQVQAPLLPPGKHERVRGSSGLALMPVVIADLALKWRCSETWRVWCG